METTYYVKDSVIYEEGMIGSELYFVINGEVEVHPRATGMRPACTYVYTTIRSQIPSKRAPAKADSSHRPAGDREW